MQSEKCKVKSAKFSTTTTSRFLIEWIGPQFGLLADGGVSADWFLSTETWMACNLACDLYPRIAANLKLEE